VDFYISVIAKISYLHKYSFNKRKCTLSTQNTMNKIPRVVTNKTNFFKNYFKTVFLFTGTEQHFENLDENVSTK